MNYLSAIVLIAILVFIHEFGHFIVAKACGVQCTVLSIGYGRRLFGFQIGCTDYRVSLLPFGGYVRMAGADPFGDGEEDDHWLADPDSAFMRKPVWKRLLIVAAGPAFNLALPIVAITALLMAGEPQPSAVAGMVFWDSPAHEAGIVPGDELLAVNGVETPSWQKMSKSLQGLESGAHQLRIRRDGEEKLIDVHFTDASSKLGIDFLRPSAEVGVDDPRSPAGRAGLRTWDVITEVDGEVVTDFLDLQKALSGKESAKVFYMRDGAPYEATLSIDGSWSAPPPMEVVGLDSRWGLLSATMFIKHLGALPEKNAGFLKGCSSEEEEPYPALVKGLETGDRFLKLNDRDVHSWNDVIGGVASSMLGEGEEATAKEIAVIVVREGEIVTRSITPRVIQDTDTAGRYRYRPVLGAVRGGGYEEGPYSRVYYSFPSAFERASKETWMISMFIVEQIGKLITGEAAVEKSLGGPVEIVRQASYAAKRGLFEWIRLMAMLSISLGIVNLVPVPVLDGGQILFYLMEAIRGKPLSVRVREYAQQFGVLFLVLLMLVVMVFDINRLLGSFLGGS
jgi:regulator of sigma E protease